MDDGQGAVQEGHGLFTGIAVSCPWVIGRLTELGRRSKASWRQASFVSAQHIAKAGEEGCRRTAMAHARKRRCGNEHRKWLMSHVWDGNLVRVALAS